MNNLLLPAMIAVKGFGAPELNTLVRRNKVLGQNGDILSQWITFQDHHFRARYQEAISLGEEIRNQARKTGDRTKEMVVLPLLGHSLAEKSRKK